eukprot:972891-Rhodomonas_salina.3
MLAPELCSPMLLTTSIKPPVAPFGPHSTRVHAVDADRSAFGSQVMSKEESLARRDVQLQHYSGFVEMEVCPLPLALDSDSDMRRRVTDATIAIVQCSDICGCRRCASSTWSSSRSFPRSQSLVRASPLPRPPFSSSASSSCHVEASKATAALAKLMVTDIELPSFTPQAWTLPLSSRRWPPCRYRHRP